MSDTEHQGRGMAVAILSKLRNSYSLDELEEASLLFSERSITLGEAGEADESSLSRIASSCIVIVHEILISQGEQS